MISKRLFVTAAAGALFVVAAQAAGPAPLELFGTPLKNAQRADLRKVFANTNLKPLRMDDLYFSDQYNASAVLEGASTLSVMYTKAGKFAGAAYEFPSRMDIGQVKRVVDFVATKYGRPSSVNGRYDLGDVLVTWKMPQGMQISVARGWPDTTTMLLLEDVAAYKQMTNESKAVAEENRQQRAKAQSKAF